MNAKSDRGRVKMQNIILFPKFDTLILSDGIKGIFKRLIILFWHGKWIDRNCVIYIRKHRKANLIDKIIGWEIHPVFRNRTISKFSLHSLQKVIEGE